MRKRNSVQPAFIGYFVAVCVALLCPGIIPPAAAQAYSGSTTVEYIAVPSSASRGCWFIDVQRKDPDYGLPLAYRCTGAGSYGSIVLSRWSSLWQNGQQYDMTLSGTKLHFEHDGKALFFEVVPVTFQECPDTAAIAKRINKFDAATELDKKSLKCAPEEVNAPGGETSSPALTGSTLSPRQQFEFYWEYSNQQGNGTSEDSTGWDDSAILAKLGSLYHQLDPPPQPPQDAADEFGQGVIAMKSGQFKEAGSHFYEAGSKAVWWADAWYNTAIAEEKAGEHSRAQDQLEMYEKLNPAGGGEARALVASAAAASAAEESREISSYITGGARHRVSEDRSEFRDFPKCSIDARLQGGFGSTNYDYLDPEHGIYTNEFVIPDGDCLAVLLGPVPSPDSSFSKDMVAIVDLTAAKAQAYEFGTTNAEFLSRYKVSISEYGPSAVISVHQNRSQAGFIVPAADLLTQRYREVQVDGNLGGRYDMPGFKGEFLPCAPQGGPSVAICALLFRTGGTAENPMALVPDWVVPMHSSDDHSSVPIGSSGYRLEWGAGGDWTINKQ